MVIFVLLFLISVLVICNVYLRYKFIKIRNKLYEQNDMYNYYKNKISMLEYHYRNYKEGKNPYTVLKCMGNIIQSYYVTLSKENNKNE